MIERDRACFASVKTEQSRCFSALLNAEAGCFSAVLSASASMDGPSPALRLCDPCAAFGRLGAGRFPAMKAAAVKTRLDAQGTGTTRPGPSAAQRALRARQGLALARQALLCRDSRASRPKAAIEVLAVVPIGRAEDAAQHDELLPGPPGNPDACRRALGYLPLHSLGHFEEAHRSSPCRPTPTHFKPLLYEPFLRPHDARECGCEPARKMRLWSSCWLPGIHNPQEMAGKHDHLNHLLRVIEADVPVRMRVLV